MSMSLHRFSAPWWSRPRRPSRVRLGQAASRRPAREVDAPRTVATSVARKAGPLNKWSAPRKAAAVVLALATSAITVTVRVTLSPMPTATVTLTASPTVTPTPTATEAPEMLIPFWAPGPASSPSQSSQLPEVPGVANTARRRTRRPGRQDLLRPAALLLRTHPYGLQRSHIEIREDVVSDPDSTCADVRISLHRRGAGLLDYAFQGLGGGRATLCRT